MVQSNFGLIGTTLYQTSHVQVQNNTITASMGKGIFFSKISDCVAVENTITGNGSCISFTSSSNSQAHANVCNGGRGIISLTSTNIVVDSELWVELPNLTLFF